MAKPIEPTPILRGEAARAFWEHFDNPKYDEKKEIELEKSRWIYRKFIKK